MVPSELASQFVRPSLTVCTAATLIQCRYRVHKERRGFKYKPRDDVVRRRRALNSRCDELNRRWRALRAQALSRDLAVRAVYAFRQTAHLDEETVLYALETMLLLCTSSCAREDRSSVSRCDVVCSGGALFCSLFLSRSVETRATRLATKLLLEVYVRASVHTHRTRPVTRVSAGLQRAFYVCVATGRGNS
jgi:hypothetical protein